MQLNIEVEEPLTPEHESLIENGLRQFNAKIIGPSNYRQFAVLLKDEQNNVVGGCLASISRQILEIDTLWIEERFRGQGYGSALLTAAEDIGREKGCIQCCLDTGDFQAPEFYQKQGYVICGEIPNCPPGHTFYLLHKQLVSS